MATTNDPNGHRSLPSVPSEAETKANIMRLQKLMGIPTEDEVNPLAPGTSDQELWPAQPGELFTDFRLA